MNDQNTTPPNAIDLALDALREYEQQNELARNSDHEYRREIAAHEAEVQRNRATILAQVAVAQALVAVAKELRTAGYTPAEKYAAALADFTLVKDMEASE